MMSPDELDEYNEMSEIVESKLKELVVLSCEKYISPRFMFGILFVKVISGMYSTGIELNSILDGTKDLYKSLDSDNKMVLIRDRLNELDKEI